MDLSICVRLCHDAGKKKSHGWCDFAPGSAVSDMRQGYSVNDTLIVTADILVLNESVSFTRETELANSAAGVGAIVSVRLPVHSVHIINPSIAVNSRELVFRHLFL